MDPQLVLHFIGWSGSGKTTLAESLLRRNAGTIRMAFVKSTHHPLEPRRRGDTERALAAGAVVACLLRGGRGIRFDHAGPPCEIEVATVAGLIGSLDASVVLLEGFRSLDIGRAILVRSPGSETQEGATLAVTPRRSGDRVEFAESDLLAIERLFTTP